MLRHLSNLRLAPKRMISKIVLAAISIQLAGQLLSLHPSLRSASSVAQAEPGWSFNLGYNNPPGASIGANFMRLWQHFAIELGIGWLNLNSSNSNSNDKNSTLSIAGDANLKYLFGSSTFRPYIQGGFGIGSAATIGNHTSAGAGVGQGFAGAGVFLMGHSVYGYASANLANFNALFFQGGIGFNF